MKLFNLSFFNKFQRSEQELKKTENIDEFFLEIQPVKLVQQP